jgi:hypothetical protein
MRLRFLIVLMHTVASWHRIWVVGIATNPQGYRVYVYAVLMCYASDKNQPTHARYHISGHNFNVGISPSYGSVIGNTANTVVRCLRANQYCSRIASYVYLADNHYYADVD